MTNDSSGRYSAGFPAHMRNIGMSVIWLTLEAPDLAITEAAVGAGVTSLLFFATLKKIHAIKAEDAKGEEDDPDEE